MAVTANGHGLMTASPAVVRAMLDDLTRKKYERGILGLQATARWDGPERFTHHGRAVRVAACPSTLAVWEAIQDAGDTEWLVVLTPCEGDDLGGGVLAHLLGNRLRTPDPWQAVRQRFAAERLDPRLYASGTRPRDLATGLLAALPDGSWTPAPGGVLTRDHALGCVAQTALNLVEPGVEVDVTAVLTWSVFPGSTAELADLRKAAGDALADEVIDWLAERCGLASAPVRSLLRTGRVADIVPLGILAGLLGSPELSVSHAAGQFAGTYGLGRLTPDVLTTWNAEAAGVTTTWLAPDLARKVLNSSARHVDELGVGELARASDLLPAGLQARLTTLAEAIHAVLPEGAVTPSGADRPLLAGELAAADVALARVREHHLAGSDDTVPAFEAVLRLLRWLATDTSMGSGEERRLGALVERHLAADAWVDAAVNDVARGSADPTLATILGHVLSLVRTRRDAHDLAFGAALASSPDPAELTVERLLPDVVLPLAGKQPALLLVLDGMSGAVATELVSDAVRLGWVEYPLPGRHARAGALAVLPTLTEFSRCSLLCGELRQGYVEAERQGFAEALRLSGLDRRTAGATADVPLFHKKQLDSSQAGQALHPDVQTTIANTEKLPLVGAVLNTVDEALHHTDPGGIDWKLETVRHLKPLLDAARRAGRTVVLTSDHGHVIERREGQLRKYSAAHGARARAESAQEPPTPEEIVVRSPRVLTASGSAVLAVNERVRYGPLNAGYHGGGSPAEVVVPVVLLHPGDAPADAGLTSMGDVEPTWWRQEAHAQRTYPEPTLVMEPGALFDLAPGGTEEPATSAQAPTEADEHAAKVARAVVTSNLFKRQRTNAGRIPMADDKIVTLLALLLSSPDRRISATVAGSVLGVSTARLRGALSLLKRVLDVEGYVVLAYEAESGAVVLDEATLREQFGIRT